MRQGCGGVGPPANGVAISASGGAGTFWVRGTIEVNENRGKGSDALMGRRCEANRASSALHEKSFVGGVSDADSVHHYKLLW